MLDEKMYELDDPNDEVWYEKYVELGGKHEKSQFKTNVNIFLDICLPAFLGWGGTSRKDSLKTFMEKTGLDSLETNLYFEAVDSITPLS